MSCTSGLVGTPPGVVSKKRAGEEESHTHRAHESACFPRGRRVCPTKCLPQGHECESASPGFEANRSSGSRSSCHGGIQLAVDVTLRSAVSCAGEAHPHAVDHDGAVLLQARQDKEATYPELASSGRYKLVVLAMETGGRWSEEAVQTLQMLAHSKARDAPPYMQFSVALMWNDDGRDCWPLLEEPPRNASWCRTDGETPLLAELFEGDPR